ncbi:MAG: hypothetical protein ACRD4K_10220 [Candidatus Acidiferrales bacterium]
MTRRGSLIYYLAAWICGCTFMGICIWLKDLFGAPLMQAYSMRGAIGLLLFNFYALIFGAVAAFLGAFLLRLIARAAHWQLAWQWTLAGAILSPALIELLGVWGRHLLSGPELHRRWPLLITYGPKIVLDAGIWLAIPVGAATAFVLYRIHRAFVLLANPPGCS